MTCEDFERFIALDVGGDLPKQKCGAVAGHLRCCRHCQEFAESLKASQALLKKFGDDTADEVTFQEIRRRVLNRLEAEPSPPAYPAWRFAWGAGLVAGLLLVLGVLRHPFLKLHPPDRQTTATLGTISHVSPFPALSRGDTSKDELLLKTRKLPAPPYPRSGARASAATEGILARKSHASLQPSRGVPRHPEQLTVKLMTDNPNVVVYWLVD